MTPSTNNVLHKTQPTEQNQSDLKAIYLAMIRAYLHRHPLQTLRKEEKHV